MQDLQRQFVPKQVLAGTKMKNEQCAAAFGSVLFYEDQQVIRQLQKKILFHAAEFPIWSEQTSGMAQFVVWTALADSGVGASLQHFNPSIETTLRQRILIFQIHGYYAHNLFLDQLKKKQPRGVMQTIKINLNFMPK